MKFEDLITNNGFHISFEQISEPRIKGMRLRIILNKSENSSDLLICPHPDSNVTTLQIDFPNYVTYSVTYDDYTIFNDSELYQGDSFRIYQQSAYLDSIQKETAFIKMNPTKKIIHYSLACFDHRVDIISCEDPIITEIDLRK